MIALNRARTRRIKPEDLKVITRIAQFPEFDLEND